MEMIPTFKIVRGRLHAYRSSRTSGQAFYQTTSLRFRLPAGRRIETTEELLSLLRKSKVIRQGKPIGLTPNAASDTDTPLPGFIIKVLGWVTANCQSCNAELRRTVSNSLDIALYNSVKRRTRNGSGLLSRDLLVVN